MDARYVKPVRQIRPCDRTLVRGSDFDEEVTSKICGGESGR
jgi:hypothetical protein